MTTSRTVEVKAAGRVLTVAELRGFVAELDGTPEDTPVTGTVRVGGAVKTLKAAATERRRGSGGRSGA